MIRILAAEDKPPIVLKLGNRMRTIPMHSVPEPEDEVQPRTIKLGHVPKADSDAALEAFLDDFFEQTKDHPFLRNGSVWKDSVVFEVSKFDGKIHLGFIQTLYKKQGHANEAMKWITELADKHQVTMDLYPQPVGTDKGMTDGKRNIMSRNELVRFYAKFGFVQKGADMVRKPR